MIRILAVAALAAALGGCASFIRGLYQPPPPPADAWGTIATTLEEQEHARKLPARPGADP